MKKLISLCLAALLLIGMMPMTTMAEETGNHSLQEIEQAIRDGSKAEIRDANGNVLDTLDLDVHVQRIPTSRRSGDLGCPEYIVTCSAKSKLVDCPGSGSKDGISATILMVCRDEFGPDNTLISVAGTWSGKDSETKDRVVTYYSYNAINIENSKVPNTNAPRQFEYYPKDYKGFTFKATSSATITSTGHNIFLEVATDSSVLS